MRARNLIVATAIALPGTLLLSADVFVTHGLDRAVWSGAFFSAVAHRGSFYVPQVPAALKQLPPAERAAVVQALGAAARAFVQTPEYRAKYKAEYERSLPDALKPPRTAQQIADEMRAGFEKQLAETQAFVKQLPADQRKAVEEQMAAARKQMTQMEGMAKEMETMERQAYEEAKSRPPDPDAMPADPSRALARTLDRFLVATSGVDYAAATKAANGRRIFVRADFEAKPSDWKLCYRAGREACEAARGVATAWRRELQ